MKCVYVIGGLSLLAIAFWLWWPNLAVAPQGQIGETVVDDIMADMKLTSPDFAHNATIPERYSCDGDNLNPRLMISGVPEGTGSLVLLVDDPDIPQEIKDETIALGCHID